VLVLAASAGVAAAGYEASPTLDRAEWATLVQGVDRMGEIAAERGLTLAVHPHQGTVIEGRDQVERFLESSGAGLCLDTGHLLTGGTDPVELTRVAGDRIDHVHLKDVSAEWADRVRTGRTGYADAVRNGLYRPLGTGDLDVSGIVRGLREAAYGGWFVLEQDTVLKAAPVEGRGPIHDASASLAFLRRCAWELEQGSPVTVAGRTRAARGATSREEEEG
jgi:inosose dehydratase